MKEVEQEVRVLENSVDMISCPGGVDHEEGGLPEGQGVIIHEEAIVPVYIKMDISENVQKQIESL